MVSDYVAELSWGNVSDISKPCVKVRKCLWTLKAELVNTNDSINLNAIVQSGKRFIQYDMTRHYHMFSFKNKNKKRKKKKKGKTQISNFEKSLAVVSKS